MLAGIAGEAALETLRRAAGRGQRGSVVLTRANAERFAETLADLRGAAMKLGQLLSLYGDDLLPPGFVEVLSRLRDQAYVMPETQVRRVLTSELGPDWEDRFKGFDFEPIAAASIGQVHAAETTDGRSLALKLQYPGVSRSISSDVDNLAVLLRVSRILPGDLDFEALIPEIKRELRNEANYRREADNTERYRRLVADDPTVVVPRVHRDLSTRHVLATDRIAALPIEDLRSPEHPPELRNRMGRRLVDLVFRELFRFRFMQTDPNFANYLFEPRKQRIALLDFGATRRFTRGFIELYRRLIISAVQREQPALVDAATQLGFLRPNDGLDLRLAFADMCELFAEPLRHPGAYDFAASDLALRVRDRGLQLLGDYQFIQPPPESLFLHRKLGGSFLLCAHIGASVDCHELYCQLVHTDV
jgi:predicted unusual protein kinase regulating ubiquinone biosynthesis (AarF/ABC1/UbiB family)